MSTWLEIQFDVDAEAAEFIAAEVGPLTGGVELRDTGTLLSTLPGRAVVVALCAPEARSTVLQAAQDALAMAQETGHAVGSVAIRERMADETEWRDLWKQFFRTTTISKRFVVRPSWDPTLPASHEFIIELDPGRAFGTGAHPSTRLVVALAEKIRSTLPTIQRFLDLGCGSGILSIAASMLWPEAQGTAVDNDAEATETTLENLTRNRVSTVRTFTGTLDQVSEDFDLVLANIQADVLCNLAELARTKVKDPGYLILSGILVEQVDEVAMAYEQAGFALLDRRIEAEWAGLLLTSRPKGI